MQKPFRYNFSVIDMSQFLICQASEYQPTGFLTPTNTATLVNDIGKIAENVLKESSDKEFIKELFQSKVQKNCLKYEMAFSSIKEVIEVSWKKFEGLL